MRMVFSALCAVLIVAPVAVQAASIDEFAESMAPTRFRTRVEGTMLGGAREVSPGPSNATGGGPVASVANGIATFSGGSPVPEFVGPPAVDLVYNGKDNSGLGGIDLQAGGADRFIVSVTHVETANVQMSITVHQDGGPGASLGTIFVREPGIYTLPFDSFIQSEPGASPLSSVSKLEVGFLLPFYLPTPSVVSLDYIRTDVPEPAAFGVAVAGAAWGLLSRRRRERGSSGRSVCSPLN